MSIPPKLFLAISLERKSVFRDVRIKANHDLIFLSDRNKMTDSMEISFINEKNDFIKEGKWSENSLELRIHSEK